MVQLEKIQSSLFPKLYDAFLVDDDPLSSEQDWRNVFDYGWDTAHDHCGYAMLDQGEIVGMLGMVFSERVIDGRSVKFCNLHTWWVREDHRGRSLALLRPILKLSDYTLTHFTPCDTVRAICQRLGFKQLNSQLRILLPNRLWRHRQAASEDKLTFDSVAIEARLSPSDKKIYQDHQPYGCGHLWIGDEKSGCYILYTYVVRHRLPYCHIHYVSNRETFLHYESAVRASLLKRHVARFVALDGRLFAEQKFPMSFNFWAPAHALYKSNQVEPHQIDNLYSDVVFLKLTTLPDMSHAMGQMLKRVWPLSRHKPAAI